jgi:branched-chain amino acid transport system ATP-binding protein
MDTITTQLIKERNKEKISTETRKEMTTLLELKSVTLKFGGLTALSNVTWSLPTSGIHGIIGPNGAGKSTLFNLVTGIYHPTSGQITFEGTEIHAMPTTEIVALGMARTFQNIRLLPHLSVLDNLRVVTSSERKGTFWKSLFHLPSSKPQTKQITEQALSILDMMGLSRLREAYPTSLPYGDQRKLEIARALMRKPKLLLLDEPAAGMNAVEKAGLDQILRKVLRDQITILVIEHDMKFIMNLCSHITVLTQGSICVEGTPELIQKDPRVIASYLGSRAVK